MVTTVLEQELRTVGNQCQSPVRAAIYARVSSPNQKFNGSISEQISSCHMYIRQKGWTTKYVFFDEESGRTADRPNFQLMLQKARLGCFDVIVFWKLDRFCRSLVDLVNVERELRGYGVGLSSVTEYIDTTNSIGRFNFRSIGSVAELERELIGERSRLGLHALAKEDRWPNPHPPLGYDKDEDGKLVVNKDSKFVLRIFEMYQSILALPQVAFVLNKKGMRTKNGKKWNATTVRGILTNQIYIGRYSVAGASHYVEDYRIVPDELFFQVRKTLKRYENSKSQRPKMTEDRRSVEIDNIFNQFLANINRDEERLSENSRYKMKTFTDEEVVFRLLQDGWDLIKAHGKKFVMRKKIKDNRKGRSYSATGSFLREI